MNDYLSLLFGRVGEVVCYGCGRPVRRDSPESAADTLAQFADGTRLMLGFEVEVPPRKRVEEWLADFVEQGYVRAVVDGATESLEPGLAAKLKTGEPHHDDRRSVDGRCDVGGTVARIARDGVCGRRPVVRRACGRRSAARREIDGRPWRRLAFSREACGARRAASTIRSRSRSCSTSIGRWVRVRSARASATSWRPTWTAWCPTRTKSIREGAIAPWNTPAYAHELEELLALASDYKLRVDVPFAELTERRAADRRRGRAGARLRRAARVFSLARTAEVQDALAGVFEPLAVVLSVSGVRRCAAAAGGAGRPRGREEFRGSVADGDSRGHRVLRANWNLRRGSSRSPGRWWTRCAATVAVS